MATLHVRNVPDDLYSRIRKLAKAENRSMTAEVVELLDKSVREREGWAKTKEVLERLGKRRIKLPPGWVDSTILIREDRDR